MQAIKDLVCSDNPVNHQLGLMLAFTEYGKSFETFMMVLDWHSVYSLTLEDWWLTSLCIDKDVQLFIACNDDHWVNSSRIYFIDNILGDNLEMECFVQIEGKQSSGSIVSTDNTIKSVYRLEKELKSIYHFLTYYDII